jgi:hypothetical protein
MGGSQCYSIETIKTSLNDIYQLLNNPNSPFEKEFLLDCQNMKNNLLNSNKEDCIVSKLYKNISNFQNKETKREIYSKWFSIINSALNKKTFSIPIKTIIEKKLRDLYKTKRKKFLHLSINNIPKSLRSLIWIIISDTIPLERNDKEYNDLINLKIDSTAKEQIEKDINRTFKETKTENEINKLNNILYAFTASSNNLGYCQGMNFIAGLLLKITNFDIIDTYYLFCFVLNKINGYFMEGFPLFNYHLYIFNHYFKKLFPNLEQHFKDLDIPLELWVGKWIQTLFIVNLPFDETCRIWDCLFIYGFEFIIPICLSIVHYMESYLLKLKDSSDVMNFFKESFSPKDTKVINDNFNKSIISMDKIIKKAKYYMNNMENKEIKKLKKKYESKYNINIDYISLEYKLKNNINNKRKSFLSLSTFSTNNPIIQNKLYCSENLKTESSSRFGEEIDELTESGEEFDNNEDNNREDLSHRILNIKFHTEI